MCSSDLARSARHPIGAAAEHRDEPPGAARPAMLPCRARHRRFRARADWSNRGIAAGSDASARRAAPAVRARKPWRPAFPCRYVRLRSQPHTFCAGAALFQRSIFRKYAQATARGGVRQAYRLEAIASVQASPMTRVDAMRSRHCQQLKNGATASGCRPGTRQVASTSAGR